uniref:Transcription initiation factor IIF subunit alpha n=1 Tax=Syphacia muris TaxID=451379 RepID=A0A0N5AE32_9BILA
MALMYPVHYPAIPFRWDEPAWTCKTSSHKEEAELTAMEKRIKAKSLSAVMQSYASQFLNTSMPGDDDDILELAEDDAEEEYEQYHG